jgi:prephenate dehydrogenase
MTNIGVVGLGLIGGSIYKDLKKSGYSVTAISQSQSGEDIYKTYEALNNCEVVFVCSAMNKTMSVLDELEKYLSDNVIVTDVCSLKEFVAAKKRPYKFIPSHPMAGTEHKGFENSFEGMFKNATWVITPFEGTLDEDLAVLEKIIKTLGANPLYTTPQKHDEAAAMISHMPMLIAQALFYSAKDSELALKMASSGFRDMTRLALSNEEMAVDMINMNHKNIQTAILKLYKSVGDLTSGDYKSLITEIKQKRSKMFIK